MTDEWVNALLTKDKLDKKTVIEAFQLRTTNDMKRAETETTSPSSAVMAAISTSSNSSSKPRPRCTFCNRTGHEESKCYKYLDAKKQAQTPKSTPTLTQSASNVEFAGHAAVRGLPPTHPGYQRQLTSKILADTGATSTMTPHRSWFVQYTKTASQSRGGTKTAATFKTLPKRETPDTEVTSVACRGPQKTAFYPPSL